MKTCLMIVGLVFTVLLSAQEKTAGPALPPDAVVSVIASYTKADNAARKTALVKVKTDQGEELTLRLLATTLLRDETGKSVGTDRLVKKQKAAIRFRKTDTGTGDLQELILLK